MPYLPVELSQQSGWLIKKKLVRFMLCTVKLKIQKWLSEAKKVFEFFYFSDFFNIKIDSL